MKILTTVQPGVQARPTLWMTSQPRNPLELRRGKLDSGKTHNKIRLLRTMLRHRQASHQELCNHEDFLTQLNRELIKAIQDAEDSSALKVRVMLQQHDVFMTIISILEYSNKKRLQQMERELQEWEEKEESKMHSLEQQVEQLNAKIEKVHEKVSFVSTYKDHEYPIKSVQVASLVRQLQQTKDSQQKIQHAHQETLLQKTLDSQAMLIYMDKVQKFMDQFEEEIPLLRAQMEQLQFQIWEPREIVFADVLLRRSKCTPDTDVILNIPVEELLPF